MSSNLWDDDDDDSTKQNVKPEQAVADRPSGEKHDMLQRAPVKKETENLFISLQKSDEIVVLTYKISDYLPATTNKDMKEFWDNKITPTLLNILKQDVYARSVVWNAFSAVRNLAIVINEGASLVQQLKGSTGAVQTAQKTISGEYENLERSIDAAKELNTNALTNFESNITTLLSIMGETAGNYVNEKVKIHRQLQLQYQKKKELIDEIEKKKESMEINNNLIHVTESRIIGAKAAVEETKRRSQELDKLNKDMEKKIQEISSTYQVTEKHTSSTKNSKNSYIIPNPNRDTQKQFYEAIIKERVARIQENNTEENVQQAIEKQLQQDLCEYKAKYKVAYDTMVEHEKLFREQMDKIQQEIESLNERLRKVYLNEEEIAKTTGLQGENLQKFLELVTRLKTDIHGSANIYKPLESTLTAIKSMVQSHIMLLNSGEQTDIYGAASFLLMKVAWLQEYHAVSCEHLATSIEYNDIAKRENLKAIEYRQ